MTAPISPAARPRCPVCRAPVTVTVLSPEGGRGPVQRRACTDPDCDYAQDIPQHEVGPFLVTAQTVGSNEG